MSRLRRIEKSRFLGREFLLWLWYYSEQHNSVFPLGEHGEVEVFLDDKIVLEPLHGEGNRNLLSGLTPATSPEATIALQLNKIPSEVKLKLVKDARAWALSLKGDDLQIRSLKIPEVLSHTEEEKVYERLYLLDEFESMFQELLKTFLRLRLTEAWSAEVDLIRQWIREKSDEISHLR
jgi:hypothetical protein